MNSETTKLLIQVLIQYGPGAVKAILDIFKKEDPTPEDWDGVLALVEKDLHS